MSLKTRVVSKISVTKCRKTFACISIENIGRLFYIIRARFLLIFSRCKSVNPW